MKFTSIDEYIASQPIKVREGLKQLRLIIKKAAPKAEEAISYGMPAFRFHGMLVWFAAAKNHYGLYPFASAINAFKDSLTPYETSKGTIRFPIDKPLPEKLISEIIRFKVNENLEKMFLKEAAKGKKQR